MLRKAGPGLKCVPQMSSAVAVVDCSSFIILPAQFHLLDQQREEPMGSAAALTHTQGTGLVYLCHPVLVITMKGVVELQLTPDWCVCSPFPSSTSSFLSCWFLIPSSFKISLSKSPADTHCWLKAPWQSHPVRESLKWPCWKVLWREHKNKYFAFIILKLRSSPASLLQNVSKVFDKKVCNLLSLI